MCADYKGTLNTAIESDSYPLPTVEEIFGKIGHSKHFAKLDLRSAYWQIELDDKAKQLSTINTHRGLFQVNRMQMGMKNSSAIFQRCIESILNGIAGVIIYQDDIMICAETDSSLQKRVNDVKKRLKDFNVTINYDKCIENTSQLQFLGFVFGKEGIKPNEKLIERIDKFPTPKNN